ncbi:hypothetical protein DKZ22_12515 [Limosilactobacillus reuteri]|uniref:Uncharacterized protein n=1 Tax=Limosilactobacillus reuteri TaxID=1598 RepID=A0A855XX97_LIMRT|nr:hypothetical protein [Limosilactobacillus reuteri]PWT35187.1 hypothetical protein DKZ24_05005 [Limosilactobacillus reuteri]PWT38765.1 hypothetical protein DKZ22_12515 [Limosilactobacillus reuteri]PWT53609.1 hypothetical protein DKZ31_07990 [Limosilactobacillus reuteri]PWT59805.1 hypothetical protein DKZ30_04960 [Limosilactobacillus reuteri]PWT64505.1 hypothetical protein DKZ20_05045 [Limosilactobacillus reuteri]
MTKTEALEQTIQIIHQDMDWFIGIVSILIALFAFFQWKLSEKQIRKIKEETLREAKKNFIDELDKRVSSLEEKMKAHQEFHNKKEERIMNSFNNLVTGLVDKKGIDLIEQCNELIGSIEEFLSSDTLPDIEKVAGMMILKNSITNTSKVAPIPNTISKYLKNNKNVQKYMSYSDIIFKEMLDDQENNAEK